MKQNVTPSDSAFYKLYLFNLIAGRTHIAELFNEAKTKYPAVYNIVKKLNHTDIKTLIDNIENKL